MVANYTIPLYSEHHMDNSPPNTPCPYSKMVERAIATVLSDNVDLFQVNHDGEKADDSLPSELM